MSIPEFLSILDGRTTALLVSIAFFIQTTAIGAQAFLVREYKGIGTALLGNLSIALGFLLLIFRDQLPAYISVIIGNTLIVTGPILFFIAVGRFTGQKYSRGLAFLIITITSFSLYYFLYINNQLSVRIIVVSLAGAVGVFAAAYKLWQARRSQYRFSIAMTIVPFLIYGAFLVFRSIVTFISPPQTFFSNSPVESATYLLLFIISFLWTIGFSLMVSQRLQLDLTDLATIDTLTRIPNRHATQSFFGRELSRIERHGGEFSLLLIDLDNFKQVNDKHGHAVGDTALLKTAQIFQSAIRREDIVGRWGGEEFLVILPNTPIEKAHILAERIRSDISTADIKTSAAYVKLTVSIGVASSKHAATMDELLKKADDALYSAKASKDAVVLAN